MCRRSAATTHHPPHSVVRSNAEYAEVMALIARGLNDCETARATRIPRSTVRDWRNLPPRDDRLNACGATCTICGHPEHDFQALPQPSYAHLLGMYLGDGSIDPMPRTWRLRIALDMAWPQIVSECASSMQAVFPDNRIMSYRAEAGSRCGVVSVYSKQLVCLFSAAWPRSQAPPPNHARRLAGGDHP